MNRRLFLKKSMATASIAAAVAAGLLTPNRVLASMSEFKKISDIVKSKMDNAQEGSFILKAPEIAENGAMVPITVDALNILDVKSIAIYVHKNKTPLTAYFELPEASAFITTRIKMAETSIVTAIVSTTTASFTQSRSVKVTLGGCGG